MVLRIHIVGRKNAGKTTLIEELIKEFSARGLRVGTIKHTHHHHEFDTPGKDSHRHRQAGAVVVGLVGPRMTAAFREYDAADSLDGMARLLPLFGDCDLLLVEGDQHGTGQKVEVWREATGQVPLATVRDDLLAVITDDKPPLVDCPIWSRQPIAAVADRVLQLLRASQD